MNSLSGPDRAYGVLQIERRNGALLYRGHRRELLASGLVAKDMIPADAEHARCGFRPAAGERWVVAHLAEPDTYELRLDARPRSSQATAPLTAEGTPQSGRAQAEADNVDVLRIVREYTRLGVGALELLEKLLGQAAEHDGIDALGRTIVHLKQIYTGLERRHCAALGNATPG